MTLAQAQARLREEHCVRKKPSGASLERVAPRRRGQANARSPSLSTPGNASLCATAELFTSMVKDTSLPHGVFDDSES